MTAFSIERSEATTKSRYYTNKSEPSCDTKCRLKINKAMEWGEMGIEGRQEQD
jgi:hypothetical protein